MTGAATHGVAFERHQIGVTLTSLPVSGLPPPLDGLRIGLLTDVHQSGMVPASDVTMRWTWEWPKTKTRIWSSWAVISGRSAIARSWGLVAELLALLGAPHGIFAFLGNHDDDLDMPAAQSRHQIEVLK